MDEIGALLYIPGQFICHKCGFTLSKNVINTSTGQVGVRKDGDETEPCPNDGQMMARLTWKEGYKTACESNSELAIALSESVKLQSHYAGLLNMYDGGERMQFDCFGAWIERLVETGRIEKRRRESNI